MAPAIVSDCQVKTMNSFNSAAPRLGLLGIGLFRTLSAACYCVLDVMSCCALGMRPSLVLTYRWSTES